MEKDLTKGVFGVLPYIAPDVLCNNRYEESSDIFSFGMVMTEISNGTPPYFGIEEKEILMLILSGSRPSCAKGTPQRYVNLANRCVDADPLKRPSPDELRCHFVDWYDIFVKNTEKLTAEELQIKNEFEEADKIVPTLPKNQNFQSSYRSKFFDFQETSRYTNNINTLLPKNNYGI